MCRNVLWGVFDQLSISQKPVVGVVLARRKAEKGLNVGINIRLHRAQYFQPQPLTTMVFPT